MNRDLIYSIVMWFLISVGQVLFKLSSKNLKIENVHGVIGFIFNRYLILTLAIYIISTAFWISIMSKLDLGSSYLLLSLSNPLNFLLYNLAGIFIKL
jgi:hypothetical protein